MASEGDSGATFYFIEFRMSKVITDVIDGNPWFRLEFSFRYLKPDREKFAGYNKKNCKNENKQFAQKIEGDKMECRKVEICPEVIHIEKC